MTRPFRRNALALAAYLAMMAPVFAAAGAPQADWPRAQSVFQRDAANIFCKVPISMLTAALGGVVEVPTVEGSRARLTIPPGTQSGPTSLLHPCKQQSRSRYRDPCKRHRRRLPARCRYSSSIAAVTRSARRCCSFAFVDGHRSPTPPVSDEFTRSGRSLPP